MGLDYKIKLASPGKLSGQLVIAGSASYSPEPPPGTPATAIMSSFMGNAEKIRGRGKEFMKNLMTCNARPMPNSLISEYGDKSAGMMHLEPYCPPDYYDFRESFGKADIVVVEGMPIINFRSKPGNSWDEKPRFFGISCPIKEIFDRYEADYRKGKLSWRMIWHVEKTGDSLLYWLRTWGLEMTRKKMKRYEKRGWFTGGLELKISKTEKKMA